MANTTTLPLLINLFESVVSLSITLTSIPFSINLAAKATERSSMPFVTHMTAVSLISILVGEGVHLSKLVFIFSGTVIADNPYIIEKLKAVVSYIIDEPSLRFFCLSSINTSLSISASNSNIAEIKGASGCLLGIIKLPFGIRKSS